MEKDGKGRGKIKGEHGQERGERNRKERGGGLVGIVGSLQSQMFR